MGDPIQVLHVDDDPEFTDLTASFLERSEERLAVETAESADAGLDRLADAGVGGRPGTGIDCVVSDYDMPDLNGIEFLERVRAEYGDLPFVLFTGKGSEAVASDAIEAGVTHYLQKESGTDQYALLANRIVSAVEKRRAERARRRHLDAIESAREGISILDGDGRFVYVNQAYADLYGYDPDDLQGEHWELLYPDEEVDVVHDALLSAVEDTGYWHGTTTGLRADGTTFVEDHVISATEEGGMVCTVRDISEREELTRDLRETRRRLELALEATNTGVWEWVLDTGEVVWDATLERVMGLDPGAFEGTFEAFARRVHPDDLDEVTERAERAIREGIRYRAEFRMLHEDGDVMWVDTWGQVVEDGAEHARMIGVTRDVTPRRERERAIERLHGATRELLGAEDRQEAAEIAADAAREILGYACNVVRLTDEAGEHLEPVAVTEDARAEMGERPVYPVADSPPGEAYRTGDPVIYEDVRTLDDAHDRGNARSVLYLPVGTHGTISIADTEPDAFDDPDVELVRILAANTAAALDRIRREREVRGVQSRYRTLVEQFPNGGVFYFDEDLTYTIAGGRGLAAGGPSPDDFEGATPHDLFPPESADELADHYRRTLAGEAHTFEQRCGEDHYRIRTTPIRDGGEVVAGMAVSQDVTAQKTHEARIEGLHRSTRRLMTAETDREVAERVAAAAETVLGFPIIVVRLLEDGALVPVVTAGRTDDLIGERPAYEVGQPPVGRAFADGETRLYEDVEDIDDGIERTPGDSMYVPIGEYGVLTVSDTRPDAFDRSDVDATEVLAANAEAALERVARTRELRRQNERLEKFAGVVSHDLRNPLNVAQGKLTLARMEAEGAGEHLDDLAVALNRMESLIDDLLTLAREGTGLEETERVALADLVSDCWHNVETADARLVNDATGAVRADPTRLAQLVENLIHNAVDHGGTDVTVRIGDLSDGFYVADDGPGIPAEERDRLFESGYSTDDGTGFGLAIVREIAEAHGWTVDAAGSADGGARFEIRGVEVADR